VVTNKKYADMVHEQLPDMPITNILCEPCRRNTAPCIAYVSWRIKSKNPKANLVITPADHLVTDVVEFQRVITSALNFTAQTDAIVTLGMNPTRPETGYGYIQADLQVPSLMNKEVFRVDSFKEKPDYDTAVKYLKSKEFFWNSGIFLWNLQAIDNAFHELLPDIAARFDGGKDVYGTDKEDSFISEIYPSCENISIDYGVLEKASNVNVLCSDFGWSDLGTWGSLFDISPKDHGNNVTMRGIVEYYDAKDNVVAVPKNKLAVIQGLEDYIVAENDDVLLICRKADEQKIRQFVNDVSVKFNGKYI
jgi:mannose-1-phosphate guanylyltransferase